MLRFYPPTDPVFKTCAREQEIPSDEEQERRMAVLADLEEHIRIAVGGCPELADLFRRYFLGELSSQELADELERSKPTAWRKGEDCKHAVRCQMATALALASFRNGEGFTIDVARGRHVPPTGYAVSLRGKGQVFPWLPTDAQVREYLHTSARELDRPTPPKIYFGGWINEAFHLDHTVIIREKRAAMRLAKAEGQYSIFDLARGRTLPVEGDRQRPAA